MDIILRLSFYLLVTIIILSHWLWIKKRNPRINLPFLVFLFFYRLMYIPIYIRFIPGDWVEYGRILMERNGVLPFGIGTGGVVWLASLLSFFRLTVFDYFVLFSLAGYFGVVIFYLIIHRNTACTDKVLIGRLNIFPWILLYPSLHMYTIMLGKDPIVFLGVALTTYGIFKSKIQWMLILLGICCCIIVRPHISVISIVAISLALLISKEWNWIKKLILFVVMIAATIIITPKLIGLFRIDSLSFDALMLAIELNEGYVSNAGTYVDMTSYSLPMKMFTYLFRPLFIDSPNALLLEYSLENLIFLSLFIISLRKDFFSWLNRQSVGMKFSFIYFIIGALALSNGLSVFGLFIRQKTMIFLNFILLLFVFIYHINERRKIVNE